MVEVLEKEDRESEEVHHGFVFSLIVGGDARIGRSCLGSVDADSRDQMLTRKLSPRSTKCFLYSYYNHT